MKKIYGEGAISMIAARRGFVFAVAKDDEESCKSIITYFQHDFDKGATLPASRGVYLTEKFGQNFDFFMKTVEDFFNTIAVSLEDGRTFVMHPGGSAFVFDANGRPKWQGRLKYKGFGPADAVADGNSVWCSYPENNAVIKFNTNSMLADFRIAGGGSDELSAPHGLFLHNGELVVTSAQNGRVIAINLDNFRERVIYESGEPIYQYMKIDSNEIILTKSGIYKL